MTACDRTPSRDQRGSATVELTLLVPALLLMLGLLVSGGRLWFARTTVNEAAQTSARAASLARTATQATAVGQGGRRPVDVDGGAAMRLKRGDRLDRRVLGARRNPGDHHLDDSLSGQALRTPPGRARLRAADGQPERPPSTPTARDEPM